MTPMSQAQWEQPSGGSVRRARERMEAGLPTQASQPSQQRPFDSSRQNPRQHPTRPRPQLPQALQGQVPIGVTISKPTRMPQWPLAGTVETIPGQSINQQYQPSTGRGMAPQRPPRPSNVPSMLDASRLQEHTPAFQYTPQQDQVGSNQGNGLSYVEKDTSLPIQSPSSETIRQSTGSSVGTIPDFPMPLPPPRRSGNLGPPPSARRGASSYYSQTSYVSPIPEESPRTQASHGSYASSAAIPTIWGSDDEPDYDDDDDGNYGRNRGFENEVIEEGRESRESNLDDGEERGLIRSASLGKRAKPSMITTKSVEKIEMQRPTQPTLEGQRATAWPSLGNPGFPLSGGTGLIDKSSSSSETELQGNRPVAPKTVEPTHSQLGATEMLGAYNSASSIHPAETIPSHTSNPEYSRFSAIRRPPRLDIDAVRDAEARGSLTSLPDLIRRATRLAAMMDRGKRPASRMADLHDFPSELDLMRGKDINLSPDGRQSRQSGFSGMLAAFPPPGLATPKPESMLRPQSPWPVVNNQGFSVEPPKYSSSPTKQRRCCGLPRCGFYLVLLTLLIIIAAAVVVPIELLVVHRSKSSSASTVSTLQACSEDLATACQNGGASSLSTGSCACLCTNGFTGTTCSVAGSSGCTTTTISSYVNVTLGESIPRLIADAQTNFSIPLFGNVILARFNSANLSCVTENALVTFDGQFQLLGSEGNPVEPTFTSDSGSASTSSSNSNLRRDPSPAKKAAATVNSILYDATSAYTSSSSAALAASTSAASASFSVTQDVLDFSRVAVLFVLQQETLDSAVSAQTNIQRFFNLDSSTNEAAQNLSIGNGNSANLLDFSVDLGNGTVGSANSSMSKRFLTGRRSLDLWTLRT